MPSRGRCGEERNWTGKARDDQRKVLPSFSYFAIHPQGALWCDCDWLWQFRTCFWRKRQKLCSGKYTYMAYASGYLARLHSCGMVSLLYLVPSLVFLSNSCLAPSFSVWLLYVGFGSIQFKLLSFLLVNRQQMLDFTHLMREARFESDPGPQGQDLSHRQLIFGRRSRLSATPAWLAFNGRLDYFVFLFPFLTIYVHCRERAEGAAR